VGQSGKQLQPGKRDRESLLATGPAPPGPDQDRWSLFDQGAGFLLLGLIYALVLTWLGFGLAAGGHGPRFFLTACVPGLVLWPAAGASVAFAHRRFGRWVCPALIVIQYLLTLDIMTSLQREQARYMANAWSAARSVVLAFTAIFLIGQAALWVVYVIKRRRAAGRDLSRGRITIAGAMMAIVVVALLSAIVGFAARLVVVHSGVS
jgi:hypothetical protein